MLWRRSLRYSLVVFPSALALLVGCGGDGESPAAGGGGSSPTATSGSAPATAPATGGGSTGGSDATPPSGEAGDAEELDVCTLISQQEVESAIGQTVGPPQYSGIGDAFAGAGLGGGDCRFEATGITPVVSVSLLIWKDAELAESSFELLKDNPAVDGLGDSAYSTQPAGDISVLAGRYELSVDLYFVDEDDAAELEMAREIATLVVSRLP